MSRTSSPRTGQPSWSWRPCPDLRRCKHFSTLIFLPLNKKVHIFLFFSLFLCSGYGATSAGGNQPVATCKFQSPCPTLEPYPLENVCFLRVSGEHQSCMLQLWPEEDTIKQYSCAHARPGNASGKRPSKAPIGPGNVSSRQPFVNETLTQMLIFDLFPSISGGRRVITRGQRREWRKKWRWHRVVRATRSPRALIYFLPIYAFDCVRTEDHRCKSSSLKWLNKRVSLT